MACEKHRDALTDLALGELNPKRDLELLSHAGECEACRESYAHAQAVRLNIDRSIETLVAGKPSPFFAFRLRARIASEPAASRSAWLTWKPIAAGALALAALATAISVRVPERPTTNLGGNLSGTVNRTPEASKQAPLANLPVDPIHLSRRGSRRAEGDGAAVRTSGPEILVPRGQLSAALDLIEALPPGRVDADQLAGSPRQIEQPVEIEALTVSPLEKPEPLDESAEHAGGF